MVASGAVGVGDELTITEYRTMTITFRIELSEPPTGDVVHRFRNLGEAIFRDLQSQGTVDIDEVDRATTHLHIRDIHPRDIGTVKQQIDRLLRQHGFAGTASLKRV